MSTLASTPASPVTDDEILELFRYVSTHPQMFDALRDRRGFNAVFGFGRRDVRVSETACFAWIDLGENLFLLFTGSANGKDAGDTGETEARFLGDIAKYSYGVPEDCLVLEEQADNGAQNVRLGYDALTARLGRPPEKIVLVIHATSARRLAETFLTIAEQESWPAVEIQVLPTNHPFDPNNPDDVAELLAEMDRLVDWPNETGGNGLPKLRRQPQLPPDLADIYLRLLAERAAA